MMEEKNEKKEQSDKKEPFEKLNKKEILKQIETLNTELDEINHLKMEEQKKIFNGVNKLKSKTKTCDYSILDEIPEINELFLNYFELYNKKIKNKNNIYNLKRKLIDKNNKKGNNLIKIILRIFYLCQFSSSSN